MADEKEKQIILRGLKGVLGIKTQRSEPDSVSGYRRLRITIEDIDPASSIVTEHLYTYCKPGDYPALLGKILEASQWPDELLSALTIEVTYKDKPLAGKTYKAIIKNQTRGGRPKQMGISPQKAQEYEDIWRARQKANITDSEFCEYRKISKAKLNRARNYVKSQSQKKV